MISLIRAEFKKVLKKKSFLVVTIIFILYALLTNVIYKDINELSTYEEKTNITDLEKENNGLDLDNIDDLNRYVENMNIIASESYKEKYSSNIQEYLIDNYLSLKISELNEAKYILKDDAKILNLETDIADLEKFIKEEDWQYFTNLNINKYKDNLNNATDQSTIKRYETLIKIEEYRLDNNIPYDKDNYLNNSLVAISTDIAEYFNLKYKENKTKEEKDRYEYITEQMVTNKYIMEHKMDINNEESLRSVLKNFPSEFGLFILIYVIMISGSIVSEEYNKGTIKYLLTKPYKRETILASKLLTVILFIPLIMLMMSIIEVLVGGLILGFNTLNIPIIIYSEGIIHTYHIFKYLLLVLISNLPMYLILGLFAFAISTIMASTSAAITITFLLYLVGNVIANLALVYKFKIFNYFVALHWDFSYLVNKTANPYGFNYKTSLLVLIIYILVILSITFIYFKKKDVKNV